MISTAFELWFDDNFLTKRIAEQEEYLLNLEVRKVNGLNIERYHELKNTAIHIKWVFEHQLYRPRPNYIKS